MKFTSAITNGLILGMLVLIAGHLHANADTIQIKLSATPNSTCPKALDISSPLQGCKPTEAWLHLENPFDE